MDQCFGVKGSMKTEDLLRVEYPSAGVTPTVAVKLFQSLFVYEAAFQDGASLMESLNQCVFAWEGSWAVLGNRNTEGISGVCERAILAYCKSLVYSTGCQFKTVLAADIFEGEWVLHHARFVVLPFESGCTPRRTILFSWLSNSKQQQHSLALLSDDVFNSVVLQTRTSSRTTRAC